MCMYPTALNIHPTSTKATSVLNFSVSPSASTLRTPQKPLWRRGHAPAPVPITCSHNHMH